MGCKVILTPRAIEDLREITTHVAADRPDTALRLGMSLIDAVRPLALFPRQGRIVPDFNDQDIREILFGPFRIVYRLNERAGIVGVSRFWHAARGRLRTDDLAP